MRFLLFAYLALISVLVLFKPTYAQERIKIIEAQPFTKEWKGWGKYSEPNPEGPGNLLPKEKFSVVPTPAGTPRRFSGRVTGLDSYEGALVGLVSIVDVWWTNSKCYEWTAVAPDGSFDIETKAYPSATKALFMLAPGHPYSFLRYNFTANEGGKDIQLVAKPGKMVRFSVETPGVPRASWFLIEPLEAYRSFDDQGQPLAKQEYGKYTAERGDILLCLPQDEAVALYIRGEGAAQHYAIIDPEEADHFYFKLLPEATLTGRLLRGTQPLSGVNIQIYNEAVPLSVTNAQTDADGKFERSGLPPGKLSAEVMGRTFTADMKAGETTEATFKFPALPPGASVREVPATSYLLVSPVVTQKGLQALTEGASDGLVKALKASGMEPAGPIEFHYLNADMDMTKPFTLEIAYPVTTLKPYEGPYKVRTAPAFTCVSFNYQGPLYGLPAAWKKLMVDIKASGYSLTSEVHQTYRTVTQPDAPENVTELLVGIEK